MNTTTNETSQPDSATRPDCTPAKGSAGSLVIWCVAVVLKKEEFRYGSVSVQLAHSMSWRSGVTEDAAKGAAVSYALETYPGFLVAMVTPARIEVPANLPNTELRQRGQ